MTLFAALDVLDHQRKQRFRRFLFPARNKARHAGDVAAVDATQSSEVSFAMIGEILILNAPLPNGMALGGLFLVFTGLALFIRFQKVTR